MTRHLKITLFLIATCIHCSFSSDPEVYYTALQLITSKGYPGEEHFVTTHDGYILGLQRIPHGKNSAGSDIQRPVVFLQHGLIGSSTNWLTNLENESLAYLLANAGFDVWLGNIRGNTYSRNHTSLNPNKDKRFWQFSFDEHALIDLPAMISYVLRVTGQEQVYYVGHSQGTVMAFAGASHNKSLAGMIKTFYALAPITTVGHVEGALKYIAQYSTEIEFILDKVGTGEFLPYDELLNLLISKFCSTDIKEVCGDILFLVCGFDEKNFNESRLPVYDSHNPGGTSVQNIIHWAQLVHSDTFIMYDYGSSKENQQHYNQDTPPLYKLSEFNVTTFLFTGGQDWLADPTDVAKLIPILKQNHVMKNRVDIPYYEHLDFIWGMDANNKVYDVIIKDMKTIENI